MNNVGEEIRNWPYSSKKVGKALLNSWADQVEEYESTITEVTKLAKEPIVNRANSEHDDALLRLVRIIEVLEGEDGG